MALLYIKVKENTGKIQCWFWLVWGMKLFYFPLCLLVVFFFFLCRFVNKQNIIKRINTEKILCLCDGSDIYSALFFFLCQRLKRYLKERKNKMKIISFLVKLLLTIKFYLPLIVQLLYINMYAFTNGLGLKI